MRYKVTLHHDEDGIAASVPGLPGCWSQGATEEEALTNVRDAIAEYLAARAGADLQPKPFRPILRGKLLTGRASWFLRHALHGGAGEGRASDFAMWFPPTKVSGKYLSQWLPHLDLELEAPAADEPHIDVEVPLPSAYALAQEAMRLDPYSPVHHRQG